MKRFLDVLLVLVTLPLWLMVLLLTACAVRIFLGAPILFIQERAGLKGRPFRLLKFRTMLPGDASDAERLTRFGRFLRAASLDELPELFHVLAGTMSLVGPRPLPVRYLARYSATEHLRHAVRPGITGLAQVNGRNALSWRRKFAYDVWYVRHRTLCLDVVILMRTILPVLFARDITHNGTDSMTEFGIGN